MPRQQILVDARLVVEAIQIPRRHQLNQVPVAFFVLAQQQQVIVVVTLATRLLPLRRHVHLAADDGMDAVIVGLVVKLHRAKQIAVVGHGQRRHLLLGHQLYHLADFARPVQQGIVGVAMQMNEWRCGHALSLVGELRGRCTLYSTC